jgi:23S rRNA pseudouridine2605 synthase
MSTERLQKLLARAGIASRRAAERLIADGRVRVNGKITKELGSKADPRKDRIEIDGRRLVDEKPAYYLLHKPREMVTTLSDPEGRATVADIMKRVPERVFPVGRLDYHTSGALLLTNDGEMAQALLHPKKLVPKTYIAKFKGDLSLPNLQALREGIVLDDGQKTRKADLFVVNVEAGNTWLQITITEGKNRQIHRMGEAIGHRVMRLSRIAFAGITTEGLRPNEFRPLSAAEVNDLKKDYLNPSKKAKFEEARAKRRAVQSIGQERGDDSAVASRAPSRPRKPIGSRKPGGPRKPSGPRKPGGPRKPERPRHPGSPRFPARGPRKTRSERETTS